MIIKSDYDFMIEHSLFLKMQTTTEEKLILNFPRECD